MPVGRLGGSAVGEIRSLRTAQPPNRQTPFAKTYTTPKPQKIQPRNCHAIHGAMYGTRLMPQRLPENIRTATMPHGMLKMMKTSASQRRAESGRRSRKYRYSSTWGDANSNR